MIKKLLNFFCVISLCLATSCANVTVRPDGKSRDSFSPDVTESRDFFLWGLVPGAVEVELSEYCKDFGVSQFQAQTTFIDGLLGAITLGIYAPRSFRVWCQEEER